MSDALKTTVIINTQFGKKAINFYQGDLCKRKGHDVVVCSAFKGSYYPTQRTLIWSMQNEYNISVKVLSIHPDIDARQFGCWMSMPTNCEDAKRIACIELGYCPDMTEIVRTFSALKFVLEQANLSGVNINTVSMPVLATGSMGIETEYLALPLMNTCLEIMNTNRGVNTINIYDFNGDTINILIRTLKNMTSSWENEQIFISYSTKNAEYAKEVHEELVQHGYKCWMAPESMPPSSDYMCEIPGAIAESKVFLLLLSPEAEQSKWVPKEVSTAINSGKIIIPLKICDYKLSQNMEFALINIQTYDVWNKPVSYIREIISQHI